MKLVLHDAQGNKRWYTKPQGICIKMNG